MSDWKLMSGPEYLMTMDDVANLSVRAPDGRYCHVICNDKRTDDAGKVGYIYRMKFRPDDDSYYAPYLIYKIGKYVGIDVKETEMDMAVVNRINMIDEGFAEPSRKNEELMRVTIVYDKERFGNGFVLGRHLCSTPFEYVAQEVIRETYLIDCGRKTSEKGRKNIGTMPKQTVDEYIKANIHYFMENGEYSKEQIDDIKQMLIERLLFSIRMGVEGIFEVRYSCESQKLDLDAYYLKSQDMFKLEEHNDIVSEFEKMSDEEVTRKILDRYHPQYCIEAGKDEVTSREVIEYIYSNYPIQAQKSYEKIMACSEDVLKGFLDECEKMSEEHKKFALREFRMRGQIFEQIHQQHIKAQEGETYPGEGR